MSKPPGQDEVDDMAYFWDLNCRLYFNGNDGADVHEYQSFIVAMVEKYDKPAGLIEKEWDGLHGGHFIWPMILTNERGQFGPCAAIGYFNALGFMESVRDATKHEVLCQLFPADAMPWKAFREWMAWKNPAQLARIDGWITFAFDRSK